MQVLKKMVTTHQNHQLHHEMTGAVIEDLNVKMAVVEKEHHHLKLHHEKTRAVGALVGWYDESPNNQEEQLDALTRQAINGHAKPPASMQLDAEDPNAAAVDTEQIKLIMKKPQLNTTTSASVKAK